MLLTIVTTFLGINLFIPTRYVAYAVYSAWIALVLVILIVNEVQIGQRSEQKDWDMERKRPRRMFCAFFAINSKLERNIFFEFVLSLFFNEFMFLSQSSK